MIYLKSALAGLIAVFFVAGSVVICALAYSLTFGVRFVGIQVHWFKMALTVLLIFAAGFAWQFRKLSRQNPASSPTP